MTDSTVTTATADQGDGTLPVLLSVNVGMPRDVRWQGKTVHTGVWKHPVDGPVMVRRLNIEGDGQGDLAGHGGEQLDLADACDVPTRWSCRTGVCHTRITPLLSGDITYNPDPLEPPTDGQVLICSARPKSDIVLDM